MTNKIRTAFNEIKAEEQIKTATILYLRMKSHNPVIVKGISFVACAVMVFFVFFADNFYFTTGAFVDLDINPSVELIVNPVNRVIGADFYNYEGEILLSGLKLKHRTYDKAVQIILDEAADKGYLQNGSLVSVTLQAQNQDKAERLISVIQTGVEAVVSMHHVTAQVDVFSVSDETKSYAHEENLSPAKYLAILDLQKVDPAVSIDTCRRHSIGEIKQLTREHKVGHHGEKDVNLVESEVLQGHENGIKGHRGGHRGGHD